MKLKHAIITIGLLASLSASAEDSTLPTAPTPMIALVRSKPQVKQPWYQDKQHLFQYTSVITLRALDWSTTEECIRRPKSICYEAELPQALVHNKVGFAFFEASMAAASIEGQRLLEQHHHRKLAMIAQYANIGILSVTVGRNWTIIQDKPQAITKPSTVTSPVVFRSSK